MSKIRFAEVPTPALPPAGRTWLFIDETDSHIKTIDELGIIHDLTLSGAGVDNINSIIGSVTLIGAGEVFVTTAGQTITVSGTPHETDSDTDTVSNAIIGGVGIVVTSGTSITTLDGHLRYTRAENDAILGTDGITIISGTNDITVNGFRTEFVSASGSLQVQIDNITAGDVESVNSLTGAIDVIGKGEVNVTVEGQNIVVSGTDHMTDTNADTVSDAIIGGVGITVTSGTSETTIDGHLRYTRAENDAIIGGTNVTVVSGANTITISSTGGGGGGTVSDALVGVDGITVISGANTTTISGFRDEFVAASGFLSVAIEDLPSVQIRRTTDYTFTGSFADITFDTTDVENKTTVLEHDDTNTDRVLIKENGLYQVSYGVSVASSATGIIQLRVRKNDSTVLANSFMEEGTVVDSAEGNDTGGRTFLVELVNGDFLSLQGIQTTGTHTLVDDTSFSVTRLQGSKGEQGAAGDDGAPGSGSTINISLDDIVTATGIGNLNFEGNVNVADDGGGKATVTVSGAGGGGSFGADYQFAESTGLSTTSSSTFQLKLGMTTPALTGTYRLNFYFETAIDNDSDRALYRVQNTTDTVTLAGELDIRLDRDNVEGDFAQGGFAQVVFTGAAKTFEIQFRSLGSTIGIRNARLDIWRVI